MFGLFILTSKFETLLLTISSVIAYDYFGTYLVILSEVRITRMTFEPAAPFIQSCSSHQREYIWPLMIKHAPNPFSLQQFFCKIGFLNSNLFIQITRTYHQATAAVASKGGTLWVGRISVGTPCSKRRKFGQFLAIMQTISLFTLYRKECSLFGQCISWGKTILTLTY